LFLAHAYIESALLFFTFEPFSLNKLRDLLRPFSLNDRQLKILNIQTELYYKLSFYIKIHFVLVSFDKILKQTLNDSKIMILKKLKTLFILVLFAGSLNANKVIEDIEIFDGWKSYGFRDSICSNYFEDDDTGQFWEYTITPVKKRGYVAIHKDLEYISVPPSFKIKLEILSKQKVKSGELRISVLDPDKERFTKTISMQSLGKDWKEIVIQSGELEYNKKKNPNYTFSEIMQIGLSINNKIETASGTFCIRKVSICE